MSYGRMIKTQEKLDPTEVRLKVFEVSWHYKCAFNFLVAIRWLANQLNSVKQNVGLCEDSLWTEALNRN